MKSDRGVGDWKARLGFPATAVASGVAAFLFGYQSPRPLAAVAATSRPNVQQSNSAPVSSKHAVIVKTGSANQRDGLRVQGFAKIGFAEIEELLTNASPEQREKWARELGELPDQPLKAIAYVAFYTAWLNLEPEEALRSLRAFPDVVNRSRLFSGLTPIPAVLPELVEIISELSEAERRRLLPAFLSELGKTDPRAAARFIDSHPKLVTFEDVDSVISTWASHDVGGAREWLERSAFSDSSPAVLSLVSSWLAKDPEAAKQYVINKRGAEGFAPAAGSVASHLFSRSPEEARQFIDLFDKERASSVLEHVVSKANDSEIGNIAAWISTLPGPVPDSTLMYALARWDSVDPAAALAWVRVQPATERDPLAIHLINFQSDQQSFGRRAVSPELVALAYGIGDVEKRKQALSTLVQSFSTEDGDVAAQIHALGLPLSQTKHLLALRAALGNEVKTTHNH